MHLRQSGLMYSICTPFTKNKERIQKCKEAWDSRCIFGNELNKVCFQHGMAYEDFKDLPRRTASDIMYYIIKHLILLKIQNMMDIKLGLASLVYKFFDKKSSGDGVTHANKPTIKSEMKPNLQLGEEVQ